MTIFVNFHWCLPILTCEVMPRRKVPGSLGEGVGEVRWLGSAWMDRWMDGTFFAHFFPFNSVRPPNQGNTY